LSDFVFDGDDERDDDDDVLLFDVVDDLIEVDCRTDSLKLNNYS